VRRFGGLRSDSISELTMHYFWFRTGNSKEKEKRKLHQRREAHGKPLRTLPRERRQFEKGKFRELRETSGLGGGPSKRRVCSWAEPEDRPLGGGDVKKNSGKEKIYEKGFQKGNAKGCHILKNSGEGGEGGCLRKTDQERRNFR